MTIDITNISRMETFYRTISFITNNINSDSLRVLPWTIIQGFIQHSPADSSSTCSRSHGLLTEVRTILRWTTVVDPGPPPSVILLTDEHRRKFRCTRREWSTIPVRIVLPITRRPCSTGSRDHEAEGSPSVSDFFLWFVKLSQRLSNVGFFVHDY